MQMTTAATKILGATGGETIRFLGGLVTIKTTGEEAGGAFSLAEHLMPAGFAAPPHVHRREDEVLYVLEGEVSFTTEGRTIRGGPGTYVYLPRDIPHAYAVGDDAPARLLVLTAPAGFERFCREVGTPVPQGEESLAPPTPAEVEAMLATAPRFGIEILPPA